MARPLRIDLAGALYHVTLRGDRREDIYLSGEGRAQAQARYAVFVLEGIGPPTIWEGLGDRSLLGSERFVEQLFATVKLKDGLREVPRAQRRAFANRSPSSLWPRRRSSLRRIDCARALAGPFFSSSGFPRRREIVNNDPCASTRSAAIAQARPTPGRR